MCALLNQQYNNAFSQPIVNKIVLKPNKFLGLQNLAVVTHLKINDIMEDGILTAISDLDSN